VSRGVTTSYAGYAIMIRCSFPVMEVPMKVVGMRLPCSGLRMGWFGGEMSLPSKLLRNDALLVPISEAKPRSARRSRVLS
jgi:hypothetical protein